MSGTTNASCYAQLLVAYFRDGGPWQFDARTGEIRERASGRCLTYAEIGSALVGAAEELSLLDEAGDVTSTVAECRAAGTLPVAQAREVTR